MVTAENHSKSTVKDTVITNTWLSYSAKKCYIMWVRLCPLTMVSNYYLALC